MQYYFYMPTISGANKQIGERIKARREFLGLDRSHLAHALNVGVTAIGNYETGTRAVGADDLIKLAKLLKTRVGYFLGEEEIVSETQSSDVLMYYNGLSADRKPLALSMIKALYDQEPATTGKRAE